MSNTRQIEWLLAVIAMCVADIAHKPTLALILACWAAIMGINDLCLWWLTSRKVKLQKLQTRLAALRSQPTLNN